MCGLFVLSREGALLTRLLSHADPGESVTSQKKDDLG
jgi:hypothetical protein